MLLLSATDTVSATSGTAGAINFTFGDDNTLSGADVVSSAVHGTIAGSPTVIWPATAGNHFLQLHMGNTTGSDVTGVIIYINGNAITGTFTVPANGGGYFDGRLYLWNSIGTPIS